MSGEIYAFPPELLTKPMAAYLLGISERSFSELVRQNKVTAIDDGTSRPKFKLDAIRAYIATLPERAPEAALMLTAAARGALKERRDR